MQVQGRHVQKLSIAGMSKDRGAGTHGINSNASEVWLFSGWRGSNVGDRHAHDHLVTYERAG